MKIGDKLRNSQKSAYDLPREKGEGSSVSWVMKNPLTYELVSWEGM